MRLLVSFAAVAALALTACPSKEAGPSSVPTGAKKQMPATVVAPPAQPPPPPGRSGPEVPALDARAAAAECAKACAAVAKAGCSKTFPCQAECVEGVKKVSVDCRPKLDALLKCRSTSPVVCDASGAPTQPACNAANDAAEKCAPAR